MFSGRHKQSQSTGQAKTVVGYSLVPHTLINAIQWLHRTSSAPYGMTGSRKATRESKLEYLYQYAWHTWTVQECFNVRINWISVDVPIKQFSQTVTFDIASALACK